MSKLGFNQIKEAVRRLLENAPQGMRRSELAKTVHSSAPETPYNAVHGAIHSLLSSSTDIERASRGVWILKKYVEGVQNVSVANAETQPVEVLVHSGGERLKLLEERFYQPFSEWLRVDADELVESMTLGGASFKSKWGTPDVFGVYKPRKSDFVPFDLEIVTAEIKIDPSQSVVAFGQACAYRLFSHKTYIVMPRSIAPDDQNRLEGLCSIYGVGLVLFDLDPEAPDFQIAVKAQRFQPDMFYANEFARRPHDISKDDFNRLFQ